MPTKSVEKLFLVKTVGSDGAEIMEATGERTSATSDHSVGRHQAILMTEFSS